LPVVPLFFYKGVSYYDSNRIQGIYPNIVDQHPLQFIRKINPPVKSGAPDAMAVSPPVIPLARLN
jgi:hypothetical protein